MRIIILGAGQVGGTLAHNLAKEDHDITLVDLNESRLQALQHRLDIQTVQGSATHPSVLIEAGIERADMLIAVTDHDEINMMACQIAYSLFRTPAKLARIRSQDYDNYEQIFCNDHIPVDVRISPEKLVTEHIEKLINYPGATEVLEFGDGQALLVTITPQQNGMIVNKTVADLHESFAQIHARVVAIFRQGKPVVIEENTQIEPKDRVLFIASPAAIQQVLVALGRYTHPNRRIIIAGGGHIGSKLASRLEDKYRIKVLDHNHSCTTRLASQLHKATVLEGDIADRELLLNENIEFTDVFCAVTNDDEANIMACLQAKQLGVRHAMALVNHKAYVELIEDSRIDHAISPQLVTIGSILAKMRRGNMVRVYRLSLQDAEAIELVVQGDELTSQVIGRKLSQLPLPNGCHIATILRKGELLFPDPDLVVETADHLILLLFKQRYLREIESLFQVNLSFMA
ncbi:Trk system potassium transporter TrkA [Legionella sp. W05-934-2]|jgi:trk system potassium uptake protein TrkA|uniref:Trk system potassium transporter TrkA n=1 Tax=Legionella sp. W05-934-2 TaxID=1198649 RepID=UPI0034623E80